MTSFIKSEKRTRADDRRDYVILACILVLALVLRVWGLNAPLWYDEIMTVETHLRLPWREMMQSYSMNHHYLYSFLAKSSVAYFGDAAWSLRLPAIIFGMGSIAAMWWLARDIAGRNIAHITALLLAISFHHIWFSQNARGYTELAFWSTLGMILYLRGVRHPSAKIWIGYGVCLAIAIFTHLTGMFFFMVQGLIWLAIAARALPTQGIRAPIVTLPLLGYVVGGCLTLFFYAPILPSVIDVASAVGQESATNVMPEYENIFWTVTEAVRTAVGSIGPIVGIVAVATITLLIAGGGALWQTDRLFPVTVALHIVLTMALLSVLGMRIWPRFFFVDIGFLMLLIVLGVRFFTLLFASFLPAVLGKNLFTAAVAAMVLVSGTLAARNFSAPKQNLFGAYELVEMQRTETDTIYSVGIGSDIIFNDHYKTDWNALETAAQFRDAVAKPGPIYFVVFFPARNFRVIPELEAMLDDGGLELVKRFPGTLGDGDVLVLKRG